MSVSKVEKRDGRIVDFDQARITAAIHKAFLAVERGNGSRVKKISDEVVEVLDDRFEEETPSVEDIQDIVVEILREEGHEKVADEYEAYRGKKAELRELKEKFGIEDEPKLTANALEVLKQRYLLKNEEGEIIESPPEMFSRVAKAISAVDEDYDEDSDEAFRKFFKVMTKLEFLPNSPTLFNADAPLAQLSACFVLPVRDSLESIFSTVRDTALIEQTGGGVGFSFSELRPEGDIVKSTQGVASGPVSFMRVFDTVTEVIKAGGKRRGAMMGVLDVDHPDIEKFVNSKSEEGPLSNFNISVAVTDDFMQAVESGESYDLVNPRTGSVLEKADARKIWDGIVRNAWKTGDPGVIFMDEVNRHNPTPDVGKIKATNPCVTGDTLIETDQGLQTIEELYRNNQNVGVVVDGRFQENSKVKEASRVFRTGKKPVYRLETEEGYELRLTSGHKVRTDDGWVEAKNLDAGKEIHICNEKGKFGSEGSFKEGKVLGWLIGDGCLAHNEERAILYFYDNDRSLSEEFAKDVNDIVRESEYERSCEIGVGCKTDHNMRGPNAGRESVRSTRLYEFAERHGLLEEKHQVPKSVFRGSEEMVRGFLQALFTADGSVQGNAEKGISVRLSSSYLSLLKDVQKILLNFGILSKIYENRREQEYRGMPDGKGSTRDYKCRAQHDLVISKDNLLRFQKEIGFLLERKNEDLEQRIGEYKNGPYLEKFKATVKSVDFQGEETVYDLKEPVTNSFVANGIVVHNCGEVPLLPYESCNLGSINLSKMVKETDGEASIDWEKLEEVVKTAVHFLDNVIDANDYPIPEIDRMTKANRKIGLGVMGFAEMLMRLGIPYDSEKAVSLAEEVMEFISNKAREKSVELGRERGSFPNFEESVWADDYEHMRNAAVTSIAPTGTISIIAGCSSSIEPLFSVAFIRNVLEGESLLEVNPIFERMAKERGFYSGDLFERIARGKSIQEMDEVPEDMKRVFVTALEIDPEWHVRMQAAFQKHVDNAVSKTINLPEDAGVEEVAKVYKLAWELNCKGVTVYRYGSKSEQVLYTGKGEEGFTSAELEYSGGGMTENCPVCGF